VKIEINLFLKFLSNLVLQLELRGFNPFNKIWLSLFKVFKVFYDCI